MRRIVTAAAALVLVLTPSAPAGAHDGDGSDLAATVSFVAPEGFDLAGDVVVRVDIGESEPFYSLKGYEIEVLQDSDRRGVLCRHAWDDPRPSDGSTVPVMFTWDTTSAPSSGTRCDEWAPEGGSADEGADPRVSGDTLLANGEYTLRATAVLSGGFPEHEHRSAATKSVVVENPVEPPSDVELGGEGDEVVVSWSAVSDVNLEGYRVQRCYVERSSTPCGSSWSTLDDVTGTSHTSTVTRAGVYRYRVASIWTGADGESRYSEYAEPRSEPTEILVEEQEDGSGSSTTSTTAPEADSDADTTESTATTQPRPVVLPRRVERSAPRVVQRVTEEDSGYEEELPYGDDGSDDDDEEAISGRALAGSEGGGDDQRRVLVPIAGGMAVLTFAGQLWYLNRRAAQALEPIPVDDLA